MWRRVWPSLFSLLVVVGSLYYVFSQVSLSRLLDAFHSANYWAVAVAAILFSLGLLSRGGRWWALTAHRLKWRRAIQMVNIGYLLNLFLPLRLGDASRIYLATTGNEPIPLFTAASAALVERLIDTLTLLFLAAISISTSPLPDIVLTGSRVLIVFTVVGFLGLGIFAYAPNPILRFARSLEQRFSIAKWLALETKLSRFWEGLVVIRSWRYLIEVIFWNLVSWSFSIAVGYVMMFAFYPVASVGTALAFVVLSSFITSAVTAIAYVPGGIGTYQASVVLSLQITGFGKPETSALALAIMLHALILLLTTVWGIGGLLGEHRQLFGILTKLRTRQLTPLERNHDMMTETLDSDK